MCCLWCACVQGRGMYKSKYVHVWVVACVYMDRPSPGEIRVLGRCVSDRAEIQPMIQTLFHTRNGHSHTSPGRKRPDSGSEGKPRNQPSTTVRGAESFLYPCLHTRQCPQSRAGPGSGPVVLRPHGTQRPGRMPPLTKSHSGHYPGWHPDQAMLRNVLPSPEAAKAVVCFHLG